jgi:predicted RNase H-like HicB family nuclease
MESTQFFQHIFFKLEFYLLFRMTEFTVLIEKDESNVYTAEVVELTGCFTQGTTQEQLLERIKEAIDLYIETILLG